MEPIKITVLGNPQALKRHRTFRRGKFIGSYDPSQKEKEDFLLKVQSKAPPEPIKEPIALSVFFHLPRPQAHFGTGKNSGKKKASAPVWHTKRPDLDNLVKFILDSLNGVFWLDDSVVTKLTAIKIYSERPMTEILIEIFQ